MPLRKGHTLVIPKDHHARVSELPVELAAATGIAVSKVANALTQGTFRMSLIVTSSPIKRTWFSIGKYSLERRLQPGIRTSRGSRKYNPRGLL